MSEWKKVRLGDVVSIKSGLSYKSEFLGKGDNLLLGMGCVSYKDRFVDSGARPYSQDCDSKYLAVPGDLILATRQQSDNLPILAMPAIIPDKYRGKKIIIGTNLYKVENSSDIDNRFLFFVLKGHDYVNYIRGVKTGTTVQMVSKRNVEEYQFLCPPKEIRKQIVSILSHYDTLIENYQQQIKLLEEAAQRLFKEWFVDLRFPSHESIKICDGVPEGWEKTNINSILTFHRGYDLTHKEFVDGPYPVVGSTSIIGNHNKYKIEGPGIVTGRSGSLGIYQLIWDNYWPHNTSLYISDFKGHNVFYIYCLLKTVDFTTLNSGGAIPSLNRNTLSNISVMEPPMSLQANFSEKVMPMFKRQRHLQSQVQLLTEARDRLLPKLMSGEISVETAQSVTSGLGVRNEQTDSPQATDS